MLSQSPRSAPCRPQRSRTEAPRRSGLCRGRRGADPARAFVEGGLVSGARLLVVGPTYLSVSVCAIIRARFDASPERVRSEVIAALDAFLHPLRGGPSAIAPAIT